MMISSVVAQTSIKDLEKAAKKSDANAQLKLGLHYKDVKQNYKKAYEWLLEAAENGKHEACFELAKMIDRHKISGSLNDQYFWLNRASLSDSIEFQLQVADEYVRLSEDETKGGNKQEMITNAFKLYDKIFSNTNKIEVKKIIAAKHLTYSKNKNDLIKTMIFYKNIAKMGDAEAQYIYGKYLYDNKNIETAMEWLKKSYEQDYTPAKEMYIKCEKSIEQKRIENEKREAEEKEKRIAIEKSLAKYKSSLEGYVFTTTVPFSEFEPTVNALLDLGALMTSEVVIFSIEKGTVVYGLLTALDKERIPRNVNRGKLLQQQLIANEYNRGTNTYDFQFIDDVFSFTEIYKVDGKEQRAIRHFKYNKQKDMLFDVDHKLFLEKKSISEYQ